MMYDVFCEIKQVHIAKETLPQLLSYSTSSLSVLAPNSLLYSPNMSSHGYTSSSNTQEFSCLHRCCASDHQTHRPTAMMTKSIKKKCQKSLYLFWCLSLKIHFIYIDLNMIFYKLIMAEWKSGPPKPRQKIPVGSQAHALNCLPKADELLIANQTGEMLPNPELGGNKPKFNHTRMKTCIYKAKISIQITTWLCKDETWHISAKPAFPVPNSVFND